jgi:hypothetical protein
MAEYPDLEALRTEIDTEEARLADLRRRIQVMEIERGACVRSQPAQVEKHSAIQVGSWAVGFLVGQLVIGMVGRLVVEVLR